MTQGSKPKQHPIFKSALVAMLVARIQKSGKRSVAENLILQTMNYVEQRANKPALMVLELAVRKLMPEVSLVSQRVGASVYQIPRSTSTSASIPQAIKWLVASAKSKKTNRISEALALEILDAFNGQGTAITRLQQNKRMAAANLVYAHLDRGRQKRTSRVGRKIFRSRTESKQKRAMNALSRFQRHYRQVDRSVNKSYTFQAEYQDHLWYANPSNSSG